MLLLSQSQHGAPGRLYGRCQRTVTLGSCPGSSNPVPLVPLPAPPSPGRHGEHVIQARGLLPVPACT